MMEQVTVALAPPKKPAGRRKALEGEEYLTTRAGSAFWWLDFTIDGRRFWESTETRDFADAAAYARLRRAAWREVKLGEQPLRSLMLGEACDAHYRERSQGTAYGYGAQRFRTARMGRIQRLGCTVKNHSGSDYRRRTGTTSGMLCSSHDPRTRSR
jgi:hypothetical protein